VAMGFALIYNTTRIFHVAHGGVFVFAAYVYYTASEKFQWPYLLSAFAALLSAALLGIVIESLAYAPLNRKKASLAVCLLTSLGLYVAIINVIALLFGNQVQVASIEWGPSIAVGSILITRTQVLAFFVSTAALVPVMMMLRLSTVGRLIRATRDNARLITGMGINLSWVRVSVFAIGSTLAGLASVLSFVDVGVDPQFGMRVLLISAAAVIIGGVGSFGGPILGSLVVMVLQSLAVWQLSPRWSEGIMFGTLILFMLFRPTGILAHRRRLEEA
jgi:branched-chain amino acid transport system permease protein